MKYLSLGVVALLGLTFSACTTARYASTTEYDDVYYTSEDRTEPVATTQRTQRSNQDDYRYDDYDDRYSERRADVDSYADYYYSDDDFHFSRRLRRFDQNAAAGNWRYYDPYFANDLYFVMGTPSWNRWYNNGWYNWNSPRFAAPFNPYDPFAARFNTWYSYDLYGPYNAWGSFYTNPWVNTYYGYNGFNDPFWGGNNFYGGGFWGNPAYCPPGYYNRGFNSPTFFTTGNSSSSRTTPTVTRVRRSTRTAATQSEIRTRQGSAVSRPSPTAATRTGSTRTTATRTSTTRTSSTRTASTRPLPNSAENGDNYLRARQRSNVARTSPAASPSRTRTSGVAPGQGRESYRVNTSTGSSTQRNAPSSNTRVNRNQGYTPSRRATPSTQQRRTTTPSSRTYTPSRSTAPSRNYSPPPARNNSSFSRPSSRSNSSVQRSSSPSRSSSSTRSSSSSRRRNN